MNKNERVAIIGAGPSGMAQLRAFRAAEENGSAIPEIVCFEKQNDWGGLWNYTWRTGTDEYGDTVHGSMYRYLWSNAPKESLEFPDYPFEEHFARPIGSYPPRAVLWDYIKGRVDKCGVKPFVRFNSPVRMVTYSEERAKFTVTAHDRSADIVYDEEFDYIVVASGHFSTPHIPTFPGIETFTGRILHSHDFRDALEFKGKNVLIIGRSYSAEDIASQCYKYGTRSVTISYRSRPIGYRWPSSIIERPLITKIDESRCFFQGGTSEEFDAIIMCTGYLHHFPFLSEHIRLKTDNRLWPKGLYNGVVWEKNPKILYLGMQDQVYTFNMFDAQAWYVRDVIMKRIKLPTLLEMEAQSQPWVTKEASLQTTEEMVAFQGAYLEMLMSCTDCPKLDVSAFHTIIMEWLGHKEEDIMGFRDRPFRSAITGTMAPLHHTPWLDALDDSLEAYLRTSKIESERTESRSLA